MYLYLGELNYESTCGTMNHNKLARSVQEKLKASGQTRKMFQTTVQCFQGKAGIKLFDIDLSALSISKARLTLAAQQTSVQKQHTNIGQNTAPLFGTQWQVQGIDSPRVPILLGPLVVPAQSWSCV